MTYEVYFLYCTCLDCCREVEPRYVGYTTVGLDARLEKHIYDAGRNPASSPFKSAWFSKHGVDQIRIQHLQTYVSISDMKRGEISWIEELDTYVGRNARGTNLTLGGDGAVGRTMSEEHRKKISAAKTGKKFSASHVESLTLAQKRINRDGVNNPFYGRTHSTETRLKLVKAAHVQYHVNKLVYRSTCQFCSEDSK